MFSWLVVSSNYWSNGYIVDFSKLTTDFHWPRHYSYLYLELVLKLSTSMIMLRISCCNEHYRLVVIWVRPSLLTIIILFLSVFNVFMDALLKSLLLILTDSFIFTINCSYFYDNLFDCFAIYLHRNSSALQTSRNSTLLFNKLLYCFRITQLLTIGRLN